ncbi:Glycosyltransferase Gtf1 [Planococcus massiliensis]|uniref:Glycosyltransferase Gtf1 n=1 Tax=Planococcus massiliensis TaxID=1499687 RepID=A0A098EJU7_9BACL|nr:alpha-glucosyltransferase N-terminal domain-containing protein [Planococcus massiliensis]CEG22132.1 Glycosyltransferase Gtf1 [Planococcus massiliensis]
MHYAVTSTLSAEFTGRTEALLKRTRLLSAHGKFPAAIISTDYNPDLNSVYKLYYEKALIPKQVQFLNIYDFLSKRTYDVREIEHPLEEKGLVWSAVENGKAYRYFDNGKYVLYKNYETPDKRLKFIDMLDPYQHKRKVRKEYNCAGLCHKEIHYRQGTVYVLEEIYLDELGKAYLNKMYDGTSEQKLQSIYVFQDGKALEFQSETEWIRFCLGQMIEAHSTVVCDERLLDRPVLEMEVPKVKKILFLQHLELNSVEHSFCRYTRDHLDQIDELVVLTNEQKEVLREALPHIGKVTVILHSPEEADESMGAPYSDALFLQAWRSLLKAPKPASPFNKFFRRA